MILLKYVTHNNELEQFEVIFPGSVEERSQCATGWGWYVTLTLPGQSQKAKQNFLRNSVAGLKTQKYMLTSNPLEISENSLEKLISQKL
jgi:hypothetical protein